MREPDKFMLEIETNSNTYDSHNCIAPLTSHSKNYYEDKEFGNIVFHVSVSDKDCTNNDRNNIVRKNVKFSDSVTVISSSEELAPPAINYMDYVQELLKLSKRHATNLQSSKRDNIDIDSLCSLCNRAQKNPSSNSYCYNCAAYLNRVQRK